MTFGVKVTADQVKKYKKEITPDEFKAILDGEYDHLPEDAFYMVGAIEDAVEKAKRLQA